MAWHKSPMRKCKQGCLDNTPEGVYTSIYQGVYMRIYHGSGEIILSPSYGKGQLHNDYGRGFYCTEDIELAREWACGEDRDGFANCYDLDLSGLSVLDINSGEYTILHWLALLFTYRIFEVSLPLPLAIRDYICREFFIDIRRYDLIKGYRADDSYFSFARDFLNGTISYSQLRQALYLGGLGEQIVIKSKKAFNSIQYCESFSALAQEYYPRRITRDKEAREQYRKLQGHVGITEGIYAIDILRQEMKAHDLRLQ